MEGQITQWSKDIKGAIRSCKWRDRQHNDQKISKGQSEAVNLPLLIAPLISFDHCVICPSIYSFWLPLWYLLVIVLSVPPFTASDCTFDIFWSLCYPSLHLQLLIAPLVSFGHCVIVPPLTASDCPFDIFWSLCCLSLHLQLLIAPLISFNYCVICSSIYSFWLPLWYLLIIVLSVPPFTSFDCPFDIFKRYQRGNQKLLMEGQINQWSKDIKGAIKSCKWRDR
jgi:hypothetical protein